MLFFSHVPSLFSPFHLYASLSDSHIIIQNTLDCCYESIFQCLHRAFESRIVNCLSSCLHSSLCHGFDTELKKLTGLSFVLPLVDVVVSFIFTWLIMITPLCVFIWWALCVPLPYLFYAIINFDFSLSFLLSVDSFFLFKDFFFSHYSHSSGLFFVLVHRMHFPHAHFYFFLLSSLSSSLLLLQHFISPNASILITYIVHTAYDE